MYQYELIIADVHVLYLNIDIHWWLFGIVFIHKCIVSMIGMGTCFNERLINVIPVGIPSGHEIVHVHVHTFCNGLIVW